MNLNDDLKSAGVKLSQEMIDNILRDISQEIAQAASPENLATTIDAKCPNGRVQFFAAQAMIFLAERDGGKYRGGTPTLADQILDQQASKVRRYGKDAYRLSEKQMTVIARDTWSWLRVEMRQGK